MIPTQVYIGLGGNIGNTPFVLQQALTLIAKTPQIHHVEASKFYLTTPVSSLPQNHYVNATCRFQTHLTVHQLLESLQQIERTLGKTPKEKNSPRIIDLDILFFGTEEYHLTHLDIPHPRWNERLFVLAPLLDLTTHIEVPSRGPIDLKELITNFTNTHNETVLLFKG